MKQNFLSYLCCPTCQSDLALQALKTEANACDPIEEAWLHCEKCQKKYPVVSGIPRFVPNAPELFRDFYSRHAGSPVPEDKKFKSLNASTLERFSYEWMKYPGRLAEDKEIFLNETQIPPAEWKGQLILDAGCGMGRYSQVAHDLGANVVAIDLGTALIRLRGTAQGSPRMHLVQGDLLMPPLKREIFDIVYSIGVIHHTPDTHGAFNSLTTLVKPQGRLSVWVYGAPGKFETFKTNPLRSDRQMLSSYIYLVWWIVVIREIISDTLRLFTTRLPHRFVYWVSYLLAIVGAIPVLQYLTFSVHPLYSVRVQENFDWLSPPYQTHHTKEELRRWFEAKNFEVLKVLPHGVVPKPGILGRKKTSA